LANTEAQAAEYEVLMLSKVVAVEKGVQLGRLSVKVSGCALR
jgi:hypothetical protein